MTDGLRVVYSTAVVALVGKPVRSTKLYHSKQYCTILNLTQTGKLSHRFFCSNWRTNSQRGILWCRSSSL